MPDLFTYSQKTYGGTVYRLIVLTTMAVIVGAVVSMAVLSFVETVRKLNDILLISHRTRVALLDSPFVLAIVTVLVPTIGGALVGWLLSRLSTEQRPLGPPDIIAAVQLRSPPPSTRDGLVSTLAAVLSLGSGASVGQYGPTAYIGSIVGSVMAKFSFRIPNLQAIAIACGVAAAISTAFNAPLAGLVFAHEVILRHYSLQAFAPATVASATGYIFANLIFEHEPLFIVEFSGVMFTYEFLLFAVSGVMCAFLAYIYMHMLLRTAKLAAVLPVRKAWRPAIAGFVVGMVALQLPDVLGVGSEALRFATIEGSFQSTELFVLIIAKLILTVLCIGFGFAGGVFSPSLLIGILTGALFWHLLEAFGIPNSGVEVYAICAMMALTSPVIGAPLTTILIIFELTRNYDLTIATMVGVVFANLLSYRMFGRSLFDVQLARKGINLAHGRERALLENKLLVDLPHSDFQTIYMDKTPAEVQQLLLQNGRAEGVVLDNHNKYQAMVRLQDVLSSDAALTQSMRTDWLVFNETTSLWDAMQALHGFVGEGVPIVSAADSTLIGLVTEADIISAYLTTAHDLRAEENESV